MSEVNTLFLFGSIYISIYVRPVFMSISFKNYTINSEPYC